MPTVDPEAPIAAETAASEVRALGAIRQRAAAPGVAVANVRRRAAEIASDLGRIFLRRRCRLDRGYLRRHVQR
jgi:hypothetical protein